MKNFGVLELNAKEISEVNGGDNPFSTLWNAAVETAAEVISTAIVVSTTITLGALGAAAGLRDGLINGAEGARN